MLAVTCIMLSMWKGIGPASLFPRLKITRYQKFDRYSSKILNGKVVESCIEISKIILGERPPKESGIVDR